MDEIVKQVRHWMAAGRKAMHGENALAAALQAARRRERDGATGWPVPVLDEGLREAEMHTEVILPVLCWRFTQIINRLQSLQTKTST